MFPILEHPRVASTSVRLAPWLFLSALLAAWGKVFLSYREQAAGIEQRHTPSGVHYGGAWVIPANPARDWVEIAMQLR